MKRIFRVLIVLTLILGSSSILTAFAWRNDPDTIIVGEIPTEFTVMQNGSTIDFDVSSKDYYLKNVKTNETKKISSIKVPWQGELGTHQVTVEAWLLENNDYFYKEYEATVTVVPLDPKLTMSVPKLIKPDKFWPNIVGSGELYEYKIRAYNSIGNEIPGSIQTTLKAYWGYSKIETIFVPLNRNYEDTPFSFIVFNKFTANMSALPDSIYIHPHARMNQKTLQARINGGKWRSIKETNKLKLKPNTKYKVEIRQKAESFHKAVILQTSYVKTKKSY